MRLAQKLVLFALAVALLPLAATGFTLVSLGERALRQRIEVHQRAAATALAAKVAQAVEELSARLATVLELVDVMELSPVEREGVLIMLYRQSADVSAALLVDAGGELLAPPVFLESVDPADGRAAGHPRAGHGDAERLRATIRDLAGTKTGAGSVVLSPVYYLPSGGARVAVALPCCVEDGAPRAWAGVELALRDEVLHIEGIDTGDASRVFVVDREGRAIVHPTLAAGAVVPRGEESVLAAEAQVGGLGWRVVVEQPQAIAFAAAASMRKQTLGWILATTAIVLLSGFLFAGSLRRTLARMMEGARLLGEGQLATRVDVKTSDEIGELAATMNTMAGQLESSRQQLEEWNRTLEQRVEARTRELEEAQAQLLVQSKMAAIGQLGAGVAHEVNNPLVGILGFTQLLLKQRKEGDPEYTSLKRIEQAAQRCREITTKLLRFSERGVAGRGEIRLDVVLGEALDLIEGSLNEAGVTLKRELTADLTLPADAGQLSIVFINLLANARTATAKGGTIQVTTAARDGEIHVAIRDTGCGIEPEHLPRIFDPFFTTKKVWTGVGLGLSVAYRIVSDHGGRIDVESKLGQGSVFTVVLPQRREQASSRLAS